MFQRKTQLRWQSLDRRAAALLHAPLTRWSISTDFLPAFRARGLRQRHFFPHEVLYVPAPGPDGFVIAEAMQGNNDPRNLWKVLLYALSPVLDEFPDELFFDDDLIWHQQHLGRPGLVATANLLLVDERLYGMNYLSDLVQRISRRREWKTRVDNRFKGWARLLLNAVLNFADRQGVKFVYSPTADFTLAHTDPERRPLIQRDLFDRVYDDVVKDRFETCREGDWWRIDVAANRHRLVRPQRIVDPAPAAERLVCLCHDTERGSGHLDVDPEFARAIEDPSRLALAEMLSIEKQVGVRATYNVVGAMLDEVRTAIEDGDHALAFHSYDHGIDDDQLRRCRAVDYRIRGYRAPRSELTRELEDPGPTRRHFDWLACAEPWQTAAGLRLENGIVKIPIHFDDYPLHTAMKTYDRWHDDALEEIDRRQFTVFGLHDCYAAHWLPGFRDLLGEIGRRARFMTLDEVSSRVLLAQTV